MTLTGLKKDSRRMSFKSKSAGPWGEGKPEAEDGVCPACGEYDVELRDGYCREDSCKRDRLIKALHTGEAMKLDNGMILWVPGHKIRQ